MQPDEEICLCFHVTRRKVVNFIRIGGVRRVSQLAECYGAGTGCGWCRPFLKKLLESQQSAGPSSLPAAQDYASGRSNYVRAGRGTPPPGATPIDPE